MLGQSSAPRYLTKQASRRHSPSTVFPVFPCLWFIFFFFKFPELSRVASRSLAQVTVVWVEALGTYTHTHTRCVRARTGVPAWIPG